MLFGKMAGASNKRFLVPVLLRLSSDLSVSIYQTELEEHSFPIDSCKTESKLFTINRLNLQQNVSNVCNTVQ